MPFAQLSSEINQETLDVALSKEAQSMLTLMSLGGAKIHVTWNITITDEKTGPAGYGHFGDTPEIVVRQGFAEWMRRKNGEN